MPELLARRDPDRRRAGRPRAACPSAAAAAETTTSPPLLEHVERARALADEVRRRLEAGVPADAAARQQRDALRPEEPRRRLGEVARVGVLGDEDVSARPSCSCSAATTSGSAGSETRARVGSAAANSCKPLVLEQLAHEREEDGTLFDVSDHDA